MYKESRVAFLLALSVFAFSTAPLVADAPVIEFDHIHTFSEVTNYLRGVIANYPEMTKLHKIGKSYLGKDLLVLEITNKATGEGLEKPGYFIDGNLHSGEVAGGEICLHTIQSLVTRYGQDPLVTDLVDTHAFYIMPKVNPDGSDHAITKPDGMRSVVRPFDDDDDGQADEDPPEDLNGDGQITRMRIRDDNGSMRTHPEDPRLMLPRDQGKDPAKWKGEWTVYSEGIDNDNDGQFNEDGTGGIDINRNFPELWLPSPYSTNPGPYPLSEIESRALADFLISLPNLTGHVNYHMTGNVTVFPPSSLRLDPITGDVVRQPYADELTYKRLGNKSRELVDNVKVQVFKIHGASPASWHGSIWGVYVDWVYYRLGVFSMIHEFGINPGVTDIFPSSGKQTERIRWSDENMEGKLFVDWTPYDHPQLGKVEIGGFLNKIYDPKYKTYTSVQCLPGPKWDNLLHNHTKWHLYLMGQSPLVRITNVEATPLEGGYFNVKAHVQNVGFLPTNVTEQSIESGIAKTVRASLATDQATLVSGKDRVDLGHLPGRSARRGSPAKELEWVVKANGSQSTVTIQVVSQKGGTDQKTIVLNK